MPGSVASGTPCTKYFCFQPNTSIITIKSTFKASGFGGLEVACWPLVPKFAGSHPAEAVQFLGQKISSALLPLEEK